MSVYSTKHISREEAESMVRAVRAKSDDSVSQMTTEELDSELHEYVYSGEHNDIVGVLYNYIIEHPPTNNI